MILGKITRRINLTHKVISTRILVCTFKNDTTYTNTSTTSSKLAKPFNSTIPSIKRESILNSYNKYKTICNTLEIERDLVNPKGVFCNNEIDLKDIQVYGFDYDYTLAYYNVHLYNLIFNLARDILIEQFKYPNEIKNLDYLAHFPIRGLHLDKRKGWLMKIDSYHNIQLSSVYYGMNQVDPDEIIKFYGGLRLNIDDIGYTQSSTTLHQYVDLFCLPEISLLASTMQYFLDKNIHFNPEYIFIDVKSAVNTLHRSQILHKNIVQSIDDYLVPINDSPSSSSIYVKEFLQRLNKNGKNTFLITNSPYWFVNFGMQSLLGSDWTNLFDLIICNARKPDFFVSKTKPFRHFNIKTNSKSWERVTCFEKDKIYYDGNLFEMLEKTGWKRNSVLYFGDHIYGDLGNFFIIKIIIGDYVSNIF
jgi:HAD superfamily 5'-nucleotidase-like hydrolase